MRRNFSEWLSEKYDNSDSYGTKIAMTEKKKWKKKKKSEAAF